MADHRRRGLVVEEVLVGRRVKLQIAKGVPFGHWELRWRMDRQSRWSE